VWDKAKKWFWNILIGVDQLANAILGGDPDETLSSRMGKKIAKGAETNNVYWLICWLLDKIDPDHCQKSIEKDEGKDEVFKL
jgi:hypothetical protein